MTDGGIVNVTGALALALADDLLGAVHGQVPGSGSTAAAITLLGHEPDIPIERLRRALNLSHPGAVRLVDRLERDGLVVRRASGRDRRAVALRLTAAGRRALPRILSARHAALQRALAGLTQSEKRTLGRLARKLLRATLRGEDHAWAICRLCDEDVCIDCPVEGELGARAA